MPALNVEFTEQELADIREAAAADGKSIKAYVHDLSVREQQRRRFVERAAKFWNENMAEFDAAFPEEAPPSAGRGAAA
ncbi:hypothetical protein ACH4U6_30365 [Streptomyces netropsis]|uniref:Uncharacterized protein n=2 Tax=Streptomyces TaxID=1883 RepID=A0A445N4S3_STRNE|nr:MULTISPECIES: hypothetical protein [Streptomyces]MBB4888910.1 hypothetical protein [Streptomyces netropsis]MBP2401634.1 hypothetical protein [Streptomyces syringium]GGR11490.1 hypothetical protein GCM10010219_15760 [Streptomyces netropsis]SPE47757.1 hypothetical protein SNS2_0162 [Streptomyces netropsis]